MSCDYLAFNGFSNIKNSESTDLLTVHPRKVKSHLLSITKRCYVKFQLKQLLKGSVVEV